jgi:hypothetical protein
LHKQNQIHLDELELTQTAESISQHLLDLDSKALLQEASNNNPVLVKLISDIAQTFDNQVKELSRSYSFLAEERLDLFQEFFEKKSFRILTNAQKLGALSLKEAEDLQSDLQISGKAAGLYIYYYKIALYNALCSITIMNNYLKDYLRSRFKKVPPGSLDQLYSRQEEQFTLLDILKDPQAEEELLAVGEESDVLSQDAQCQLLELAGAELAAILRQLLVLGGLKSIIFLYRMRMVGFKRDFFEQLDHKYKLVNLLQKFPNGPVPAYNDPDCQDSPISFLRRITPFCLALIFFNSRLFSTLAVQELGGSEMNLGRSAIPQGLV